MSRSMVTKSGNDRIYTPDYLAKEIVERYKPTGRILEPCCGEGAFLKYMPTADWCEIDKGRDFLTVEGHWDWIITNPPYSKYLAFLEKAFQVADNVVFLQFVNAFFMRKRVQTMHRMGFVISGIWYLDTPAKPWPQTGFQVGCIHFKRSNGVSCGPITCKKKQKKQEEQKMSMENILERIAIALEKLAGSDQFGQPTWQDVVTATPEKATPKKAKAPKVEKVAEESNELFAAEEPKVAELVVTAATEESVREIVKKFAEAKSPEEAQAILQKQFKIKRLREIKPEQYQAVIEAFALALGE